MKRWLKHILYWYLFLLARIVLRRFRPKVIAVAGTVNKAFAKEAIAQILASKGHNAEMGYNGFNTEIGLPLAILGLPSGYESYARWASILPQAFLAVLRRRLPEVLVLELGVARPGDLKRLLRIVQPDVAVITDLTQRYRENFSDISALAREYRRLIEAIPSDGLTVLNYDTITVKDLDKFSKAPVFYFSLSETALGSHTYAARDLIRSERGQSVLISAPSGSSRRQVARFGSHHVSSLLIAEIVHDHFTIS